jgi:hypothetical protein
MAMNKSKDQYGRVNTENITGKKVPRKSGVSDETGGKAAGTRDIRNVGGKYANFVRSGG